MLRLLTLSPERLAAELRHVEWAAAEERLTRQRTWKTIVVAGAWLGAGYALLAFSLRTADFETGNLAFWAALAVGNFGPMMTGLRHWNQSET